MWVIRLQKLLEDNTELNSYKIPAKFIFTGIVFLYDWRFIVRQFLLPHLRIAQENK